MRYIYDSLDIYMYMSMYNLQNNCTTHIECDMHISYLAYQIKHREWNRHATINWNVLHFNYVISNNMCRYIYIWKYDIHVYIYIFIFKFWLDSRCTCIEKRNSTSPQRLAAHLCPRSAAQHHHAREFEISENLGPKKNHTHKSPCFF